jgi:hypothetical protein
MDFLIGGFVLLVIAFIVWTVSALVLGILFTVGLALLVAGFWLLAPLAILVAGICIVVGALTRPLRVAH